MTTMSEWKIHLNNAAVPLLILTVIYSEKEINLWKNFGFAILRYLVVRCIRGVTISISEKY